jgi:hypothetical protein
MATVQGSVNAERLLKRAAKDSAIREREANYRRVKRHAEYLRQRCRDAGCEGEHLCGPPEPLS